MTRIEGVDPIANQLLYAIREAKVRQITDEAEVEHLGASIRDSGLTILGHLGAEALVLCSLFEKREQRQMGTVDSSQKQPKQREVARYAQAITANSDGQVSPREAERWAKSEFERRLILAQYKESERLYEIAASVTIDADGYQYFGPAVSQTDTVPVGNHEVSQQWRAVATLPCEKTKLTTLITIQHEFKSASKLWVTPGCSMAVSDAGEIDSVSDLDRRTTRIVDEEALLFPLGILKISKEHLAAELSKRPQRW